MTIQTIYLLQGRRPTRTKIANYGEKYFVGHYFVMRWKKMFNELAKPKNVKITKKISMCKKSMAKVKYSDTRETHSAIILNFYLFSVFPWIKTPGDQEKNH